MVRFAGTQSIAIATGVNTIGVVNQGTRGLSPWTTILSSLLAGPLSSQITTTLGTATQIITQATSVTSIIIKNTDATNPVEIGNSSVTFGTGYRLKAGEVLTLFGVPNPSLLYAVDNGVNTIVVTAIES